MDIAARTLRFDVNEIIRKYLLSGVPYVGPSSVCLHIFVVELYSFSLN